MKNQSATIIVDYGIFFSKISKNYMIISRAINGVS